MSRASEWRGAFREGQGAEFTSRRGREEFVVRGVLTAFSGRHWTLMTAAGKEWRVPAAMLRASVEPIAREAVIAAVDASDAAKARRVEQTAAAQDKTHARLAPLAANFQVGQRVEAFHCGSWGWQAVVLDIDRGKLRLTNPTRGLFALAESLGLDAHAGRRTAASITVWANRVRVPRDPDRLIGGAL